jgi:hypothetical protein
VFSISFDDLVKLFTEGAHSFDGIFGSSATLDNVFSILTGSPESEPIFSSYAAYRASEHGIPWFTDEALTFEFDGEDTVKANTKIYLPYPFWKHLDEDWYSGELVGTITGSITLTDIPAGLRFMNIAVSSLGNQYWKSNDTPITGYSFPGSTVDFSIPVYDRDNFIPGQTYVFRIYVELPNNRGYRVYASTSVVINSVENLDVGSLGSVSLAYVELTGTINISHNNAQVPWVYLYIQDNFSTSDGGASFSVSSGGNTFISGTNTSWSLLIPRSNHVRNTGINITGFPRRDDGNWNERMFDINVSIGEIPANQSLSNINLNIGNLQDDTIRVNNPPSGEYQVFVTDTSISPWNVEQKINVDHIASGSGSGPLIDLTWKSKPEMYSWYVVLIKSGTEIRYTSRGSQFINGIGWDYWNSMIPINPVTPDHVEIHTLADLNAISDPADAYAGLSKNYILMADISGVTNP